MRMLKDLSETYIFDGKSELFFLIEKKIRAAELSDLTPSALAKQSMHFSSNCKQ